MTHNTENEQKALSGFTNKVLASVYKKLVKTPSVAEFEPLNIPPDPEPIERHKDIAMHVLNLVPDGLYRKSIINESVYAKPENILSFEDALNRGQLYPLPKAMDAPFECIDNKEVGRVSHTVWILFYTNRHVEIRIPTPTTGRLLIGGEIIHVNDPADSMPEDINYALKVIIGTELINNSLRGCCWVHYAGQKH